MAKERKNSPVRIDDEALRLARIAASYKQMGLAEYISEALADVAQKDIEKGHAALASGKSKGFKRPESEGK